MLRAFTQLGPAAVIAGILGLALLMVVHEGGHFLAARAFGMRVTRFSIGFGPTLLKVFPKDGYFWLTLFLDRVKIRLFKHDPKRFDDTIYQVAVIPFFAFVQIAGMNPMEEVDENDKGSYANASLIGRITAIFAGPAANYLFASVFFFLGLFFGGIGDPKSTDIDVIHGRPAEAAAMRTGDKIVEVAGVKVKNWEEMAKEISSHPAQAIAILVEREGQQQTIQITPANEEGKGRIGVQQMKKPLPAGASLKLAVLQPPEVVKNVVVGLYEAATQKAKAEFMGPLGIVRETAKAASQSPADLAQLLGIISAYLGAFNLFPLPALDGGRLVFLAYEATTRRRANAKIEAHIHAVGLVLMLSLMLYITVAKDLHSK